MTIEEYFAQARFLDQKINFNMKEIDELRALACSLSSVGWEEHIKCSGPKEARFVHTIEKIMDMEAALDREIDLLVDLKEQIKTVIDAIPDREEQLVLRCRVLRGYNWSDIGKELHMDPKTAKNRYDEGLSHAILPEFPIII